MHWLWMLYLFNGRNTCPTCSLHLCWYLGSRHEGGGRFNDDIPRLAEPDKVSNPTTDTNELSSSPAGDSGHTDQPKRRAPSNGHGRTSPPSRLAQSWSRTTAEDFQKGLSRCSASPAGAHQSQYMFQLGDSGVVNGVSILFQHLWYFRFSFGAVWCWETVSSMTQWGGWSTGG